MRILVRDVLILFFIFILWVGAIYECNKNQWTTLFEAVIAFPSHLLISIGYFAAADSAESIIALVPS